MLPIGCHWWKRLWDPVCTTASMSVPGACMMSVGSGTEPLYNTLQHLDPVRRLIDPYANRQVFVHGSGSDHGTRGMRLPNKQVSDKRFTGLRGGDLTATASTTSGERASVQYRQMERRQTDLDGLPAPARFLVSAGPICKPSCLRYHSQCACGPERNR